MSSSDKPEPILRASLDGEEFARVYDDQVPCESNAVLRWSRLDPTLTIADAQGGIYVYDFASIAKEGDVAAMSLRVGPGFVVQTDCLIGKGTGPTVDDFTSGRVLGVRLQPFFLPGSEFDASSLRGRGLFKRGLRCTARAACCG
jgi:hypothetical protein